MRLGAVFVHYHTPELLARAVETLAEDARGSGLAVDVAVVDNGSDPAGRELLARLPVELVEPGENLGFAAGVNRGVASLPAAEALVIANPDLEVIPGCLAALTAALAAGAAAAGPRLYWDRGRRLRLPPAERRDTASELLARLAQGGGEGWARRARGRWRRHARRHWQATRPLPSFALSGALLAVSRRAWLRVGELDERYRLYFEETDWLLRARALGCRAVYEPRAGAVHHYNRSAAGEPRAAAWFAESSREFTRRHRGRGLAALLAAIERRAAARPARWPEPLRTSGGCGGGGGGEAEAGPPELALDGLGAAPAWVEVSPSPTGLPAAGEPLAAGAGRWRLPEEVWEHLAPGRWRLTVTDAAGRELLARSCERPAGGTGGTGGSGAGAATGSAGGEAGGG